MVPDISLGSRTIGLLAYLYRTSDIEAHIDPHVVAAYDPFVPDPGRQPDATLSELAADLDQWVDALGDRAPERHVWHCPVRAAPTDRSLSDAEWAAIARRVLHATGIAPDGDDHACRWIAVRHAPDHIHLVATLVRADRTRPRRHKDALRAQAECRRIEEDLGLRRLKRGDGTAAQRPTSAEKHKAERLGQEATSRELLRERVRRALAGAADEAEFFGRLAGEGVRTKPRRAPSGDLLGYSVALPGDRNARQEPIWFSGSKLAPDLSLPRIRERLTAEAGRPEPFTVLDRRAGEPAAARARRFAAHATDTALTHLTTGDQAAGAAQLTGIGEVLDALAQTSTGHTRAEIREAARAFERATRSHVRAQQAHAHALRRAARQIVHSGPAIGRDGAVTALLLDVLVLTVIAAGRWHAARHHAQQAEAARRTATHLRAAYQHEARAPLTALRTQGERLPTHTRQRHLDALRTALPELADRVAAEPNWPALASALDRATRAGHDPTALLSQTAAQRELGTADSVSDVLIWRLHRIHRLNPAPVPAPAPAPAPARRHTTRRPRTPAPAQATRPRRGG